MNRFVMTAAKKLKTKFGPLNCPACSQPLYRQTTFTKHVDHCCPDLLERVAPLPDASADESAWMDWVVRAREMEVDMYDKVLDIAFRRQDETGAYLRQGPKEILEEIHCFRTVERAQRILKCAGKSIPMPADDEPIDIIHEDEFLLCLNKPPLVITAPKHRFEGGSMVNRVLGNKGKLPFVVHRLDMNTSGVLLFAKSSKAASLLHEQFRNKTPRKTYLALVMGVPTWDEKIVDAPIGQSLIEKVARTVTEDGKPAVTEFKVIASSSSQVDFRPYNVASCMDISTRELFGENKFTKATLIECRPHTGRTHQIRVHLAHVGHPIIGDDLYGVTGPCISRHALHAASITFKHPSDGSNFSLTSSLPDDMREACTAVSIEKIAT